MSCIKQSATDDTKSCNDKVTRKSIPRVDWSDMSNRDKYTACLNKCVNDIIPVSNVNCLNCKDAQLLVNELNSNVIEGISKACSEIAAPFKQDIGRAKRRPWWSASTKLSKNVSLCGMAYGSLVTSRVKDMCICAISSPKQDIGRLAGKYSING